MFIYIIVCTASGKLYIGQHKGTNLGKYLSKKFYDAFRYTRGNSHLFNAMRKYPRETWSIWPLVSGIESKTELDELERHFIRVLKAQHPAIGYNICRGGEGHTGPGPWRGKKRPNYPKSVRKRPGWVNSTSFKNNHAPTKGTTGLTAWNKGKKMQYLSEDTRQRSLAGLKPCTYVSEETRKKMSDTRKRLLAEGVVATPSNQGYTRTLQWRKNLSAALLGRRAWNKDKSLSDAHIKNLSLSHIGKSWSALRRARFEQKREVAAH